MGVVTDKPLFVIVVALLFSVVGFHFAKQLTIDTDFSKLIPPEYPSVQALEKLRETVGSESSVDVGIVSPSFEANKRLAEALIAAGAGLKSPAYPEPFFTRYEFRKDNQFLKDNALYFSTFEELDALENYLVEKIEDAKLEANPFFFDLEDEEIEEEPDSTAEAFRQVYDDLVGKEYPVSEDSTTLVVRFYPSGSQTNLRFIEDVYAALQETINGLNPATFHPEMEVVLAGRMLRQLTEVQAITRDVRRSFGSGVLSVLFIVLLYFFYKSYRARAGSHFSTRVLLQELLRLPALALVITIPLLMSLCWTFGVAFLSFGSLNLMTSTLGLVLFGLGIDFGIHFFARYTEERLHGQSVADAVLETFYSTGQAIAIGAITTATALYILVLADFRGFSEFGFIAGTGILFALVAMIIVLPALLVQFERIGLLRLESQTEVEQVPVADQGRIPGARGVVIGSLLAVVVAIILLPRVTFEYDFSRLEPVYESYNEKSSVIGRVFSSSGRRNPAYIVVDEPSEVQPIVDELQRRMDSDVESPTIRSVESLQERFPQADSTQDQKLGRLTRLRALLSDPFVQAEESEDLKKIEQAAQTREPIALKDVPEYLVNQFRSKSGEIGNFVIIYPSVGLSDGWQSIAFSNDVGRIETADGKVYHAGSTSLVAADMLKLMREEAPWMVGATFLIVVLLMWLNFGNVRWAFLATIPLVVGVLWMLLMMELFGVKLNFYNLIVLPAVLGIGNDAGVHLVHRYRELGPGSMRRVLRMTGEHVAVGSFTTMIGFAGLLLSYHPGLHTIGELAVLGIGATLASALVFLPALLQWIENRRGKVGV